MRKLQQLSTKGGSILGLCLLAIGLLAFMPKEKLKGTFYQDAAFSGVESTKKGCVLDSGVGMVMQIAKDHENPLFPSEVQNRVTLQIHFDEAPKAGQRIHLPKEGVQVCYWEKGDLMMFKTSKPKGWIQFNNDVTDKTVSGELDLKLVKPHYNMSNSDYHYMGGAFKLKVRPYENDR